MLTANKLEKIMELEDRLRAEYQEKLDAKTAQIESLEAQKAEKQATIDKQLETIAELSEKAVANQNIEQQKRELGNRSEKLAEEVATLKKRTKSLQKDLAAEREELKTLKQYDPQKMKKNLDASKKKLAEKTQAADLLQKSLSKSRGEKAELERKVKEMEVKLEELQATLETDGAAEEEAA